MRQNQDILMIFQKTLTPTKRNLLMFGNLTNFELESSVPEKKR